MKTGVLLINLGTPDSYSVKDVRSYLRQFLMDSRVIDIPYVLRFILVHFIIAVFRAPSSAKLYKQLWTENGSPLLFYTIQLKKKLATMLDNSFYEVEAAMRYKNPSIEQGLNYLKNKGVHKIIILPLYPQYASATTGSTLEEVYRVVSKWQIIPEISTVNAFYNHQGFIDAWQLIAQEYINREPYDAYVFSYHGLPKSQIIKADTYNVCYTENCCEIVSQSNRFCYRSQCIQTTKRIVEALDLPRDKVYNCFQSRLGKTEWIKPYAEDIIKTLAKNGVKKVLAFSPAFVADCLETTLEVGEEYKELFKEHGGETWTLVESLNTSDKWLDFLVNLVKRL